MNLDKRLTALLKQAKLPFIVSLLFGTLLGIAIIVKAKLLSVILDEVFLKNKILEEVLNYIFLLVIVVLLQFLISFLKDWASSKTSAIIKTNLRIKLINHIQKLGPVKSRKKSTGELSNLILEGIEGIDAYFSQYLPGLFFAVIVPVSILVFVFHGDFLSGLILLITAPLIPFFMILIGGTADKLTKKQWNVLQRMSSYFLDVFQGILTLKLFNKSKDQIKKIEEISSRFRNSTMKILRVAFLSALALEILASISTAIIAVEIGLRLLYGKFDYQTAMFILILAPEFYLPLRRLGSQFHSGQESIAAAQKLYEILKIAEKSNDQLPINPGDICGKDIRFRDVSFKYDTSDEYVVKNINLELESGKVTALVGASGAGKSTIANLLLKFINPSSGTIQIADFDLENVNTKDWHKNISLISQTPYMFHKSVKENIDIANNCTENEIIDAARKANIDRFIQSLPQKYETIIGEQGARLSGGQKQRLALARAFLKNSTILILDEPTSNLDPQTEELIIEAINNLTKDRTVLIIAHKLKTIQSADKIILIKNGEIQESGTYTELMNKKMNYFQMISQYV